MFTLKDGTPTWVNPQHISAITHDKDLCTELIIYGSRAIKVMEGIGDVLLALDNNNRQAQGK